MSRIASVVDSIHTMKITGVEDKQKKDFGSSFLAKLTEMPFGALSKSELELAIFSALVKSEIIDVDSPNFELARKLQCTPAKASSLGFTHRLRSEAADPDQWQAGLADATHIAEVDVEKGIVVLNIEQRYWRELLTSKLKERKIFTDTSFNRERIKLDADAFMEECGNLFGTAGDQIKEDVKKGKSAKKHRKRLLNLVSRVTSDAASGAAEAAGEGILTGAVAFLPAATATISRLAVAAANTMLT